MGEWWNGRHRRLKISCSDERAGSTPASATNFEISHYARPRVGDLVINQRSGWEPKIGIVIKVEGVKMLVRRGSQQYWYNRHIDWKVIK